MPVYDMLHRLFGRQLWALGLRVRDDSCARTMNMGAPVAVIDCVSTAEFEAPGTPPQARPPIVGYTALRDCTQPNNS